MQIAGIQKMTLVDFPGRVAATIFTRGCSFRCPFCHNPELVLPEKFNPLLSEKQILDFLESRYGKLNGICITGGEPCLQPDIAKFISYLKALGYDVKLDSNGSFPDRLKKIIDEGDVDYIAMDIKAPLSKYDKVTGCKVNQEDIKKSIQLIMNSGVDYEFRTTVSHPLHEIKDFEEIGEMIKGAKKYFIQNYQHTKQVDESAVLQSFTDEELTEAKKIMNKYVDEVGVR
jgi:pyruvate formate lyase activating enzyme